MVSAGQQVLSASTLKGNQMLHCRMESARASLQATVVQNMEELGQEFDSALQACASRTQDTSE